MNRMKLGFRRGSSLTDIMEQSRRMSRPEFATKTKRMIAGWSLWLSLIVASHWLIFLYYRAYWLSVPAFLFAAGLLVGYLANERGKSAVATWVLIYQSAMTVAFYALCIGPEAGAKYYFLVNFWFCLMFYRPHELGKILRSMAFALGLYALSLYGEDTFFPGWHLPIAAQKATRSLVIPSTFGIMLVEMACLYLSHGYNHMLIDGLIKSVRREKRERELLLHSLPDLLLYVDQEGVIKRMVAPINWYWPLDRSRVERLADVLGSGYVPKVLGALRAALASNEAQTFSLYVHGGDPFRNGAHYEVLAVHVADGDFMLTVRDVTGERSLESSIESQKARLVDSAKMSSLGEMASAVAAEISHPAASLLIEAWKMEALLARPQLDADAFVENARSLEETSQAIAEVIGSLRKIASDARNEEFSLVRVGSLVRDAMVLCRERFSGSGITLNTSGPDDMEVRCRSVAVLQVLLNLLNNAFDAVKVGAQGESRVSVEIASGLEEVTISVIDTGPGVAPEIRRRIFQPFFTTKELEHRSGLGLCISKSIVEEHQGRIWFERTPRGTQFSFTLPLAKAKAA